MRNDHCPICGNKSSVILQLHFNQKLRLPTEVTINHCGSDSFLFVADVDQHSYDEYYNSVANDSYHAEMAGGDAHSPMAARQCGHLLQHLEDFFSQPRDVLDFGCGEGWLLTELASKLPQSTFLGFDPSPASEIASRRARALGLSNLRISGEKPIGGSFDLVIASHLLEHLIDFDILRFWSSLLAKNGLLYIEVPDALHYSTHERIEFLYYFDRLHVNHFSAESLAKLLVQHGFGYLVHVEYGFPYRDGKEFPALGMLFQKRAQGMPISSPSIVEEAVRYISQEQQKATVLNRRLRTLNGVLVWGAGDNFCRSSENGGPLSDLPNMIVLDQRPRKIIIGSRTWTTETPAEGIRRHPWPVVVTVSEGRKEISNKVREIDSGREILFV